MDFSHLPGGDLVAKGLEDLACSNDTVEALLVSIAYPRLRAAGLVVSNPLPDPEHRLYLRLAEEDSAHSRYNALLRRLTSLESALECSRSLAPGAPNPAEASPERPKDTGRLPTDEEA